jgi:CBS domain-containing protein
VIHLQEGSEMQTIAEVMTTDVEVVRPEETLRDAARAMADLDVGSLPVCDGRRMIGMVTDRDITIRGVAEGKGPDTPVRDVMTDDVVWCTDTDSVDEVLQQMSDAQVRRIPVVDRDRQLVGIVALGDIALEEEDDVDETLRDISMPS